MFAPDQERIQTAFNTFFDEVLHPLILQALGDVSNKTVLEVGTGNGIFASKLDRQNPTLLVVTDPDGHALIEADSLLSPSVRMFQESLEHSKLTSAFFNRINVSIVLGYINNYWLPKALEQIERLLAPGGTAVITITDDEWNQTQKASEQIDGGKRTLEDYRDAINSAGLSIQTEVAVIVPNAMDKRGPFYGKGGKIFGYILTIAAANNA